MKTTFFLNGALMLLVCTSCDGIKELSEICDSEADDTNLHQIEFTNSEWNDEISKELRDPSFTLDVCKEHFHEDDLSGIEVDAAIKQINRIGETEAYIRKDSMNHMTKQDMYADPATGNYFDYAFNDTETYAIPCRNGNDYPCGDYSYDGTDDLSANGYLMTCCRFTKNSISLDNGTWGGSGKTEKFNISVNSACYSDNSHSHPDFSSNRDFPRRGNIIHELGHGFGMQHSNSTKEYISCMQGNTDYPTAFDAAFYRHFYPKSEDNYINLAISTITRPVIDGDFVKRFVDGSKSSSINPKSLANGTVVFDPDNSSTQSPQFNIAWFNNSTKDVDESLCVINAIVLESLDGDEKLVLHMWKIATMPMESQDQFLDRVTIDQDKYDALDKTKDYQITFYLDYANSVKEKYEDDNSFSYPISLN